MNIHYTYESTVIKRNYKNCVIYLLKKYTERIINIEFIRRGKRDWDKSLITLLLINTKFNFDVVNVVIAALKYSLITKVLKLLDSVKDFRN